jgi:hypothetical protein
MPSGAYEHGRAPGEAAESFFDAHRARVARAFDQAAIAAVAIER